VPTLQTSVYQSAYLELLLEKDLPTGLAHWQRMCESALGNWELGWARQLLSIAKRALLDPSQQGAVLHLEGLLWEQWGDWPTARRVVERAVSTYREAGYPRGEMVALNALANILRRDEQRYPEAIPLYQGALEIACNLQDEQAQAGILNNLGLVQYSGGDLEAALSSYEQALQLARRQGDREREGRILHNQGSLAWSQGRMNDAEGSFTAALEVCRERSDWVGEAETLSSLGITWEAQGDWDKAAAAYRQALEVLQEVGDHYGQAQVLTNLGNVAWLQGQYEEAIQCYESGLSLARSLGDAQLEGSLLGGLGDVYRSQGRVMEAEEMLRLALVRKMAAGDRRSRAITYLELGALLHQSGRLDEAEIAYRQALDAAQATNDRRVPTHTQIDLARLAMLRGQVDIAYEHLDEAEALARELDYREALGDICRLRGDILLTLDNADGAQVSRYYTEALAYAADFNASELEKHLNYLGGLLRAMARDGEVEAATMLCKNVSSLWKTAELDILWPQVPEFFVNLMREFGSEIA
jgi:tetratricopeptide (TPR) repeat protein